MDLGLAELETTSSLPFCRDVSTRYPKYEDENVLMRPMCVSPDCALTTSFYLSRWGSVGKLCRDVQIGGNLP